MEFVYPPYGREVLMRIPTVCSFQYSGALGTFLLVVPGVFSLFAACVLLLGFAWFSLFLLFFIFFAIFSYVPSEQPVGEITNRRCLLPCRRLERPH